MTPDAEPPVVVESLRYRYASRIALDGVSLSVAPGEIFGLLGPNGSGKTTLFRVLSTLVPPQEGRAVVLGHDLAREAAAIRREIGVVFQAPSLDKKLTAAENLRHQGHLYGLRGAELSRRIETMLKRVGMFERKDDLTEKLSGGQRRRVELAKGLLHAPKLLLLDEPSTGLDPGARRDLMGCLKELAREGVTSLLTTHLLEEADACTRLAILNEGKRVALDTPEQLKARIGGEVVTVTADEPEVFAGEIKQRFEAEPQLVDGTIRIERPDGHRFVAQLGEAFGARIKTVSVGRPTLEDVFIHATGRRFWENGRPS